MSRQFLVCDSYAHAELVDGLVLQHWQEVTGDKANAWSEVYTDGERYGIYWGSSVSDLFGVPEIDPSLVLAGETDEAPWTVVRPSENTSLLLVLCDSLEQAIELSTMLETKVFVDYQSDTRYAVQIDEQIQQELQGSQYQDKIVEGEPLVRENGQFVSGNWEEVDLT